MNTTIAAISTPVAPAGLGVIRLSGPLAIDIANAVFRAKAAHKTLSQLAGYTALFGYVYDHEGDIDECVALVFRAPHSYTGEDVVEFSCHGGLYILQRALRALYAAGAVPAEAGEYTRRAFINGKIDLTRAEAVMDLIAAKGRLAAKTALAAREGAVFQRLEEVKAALLLASANLGAFVDYPDDDIPELAPEALEVTLITAKAQLQTLLSTYDAGRIVREGIDTVIVGSPNVGKSTLMNVLAGCERSIVTDIAGTTRDIVEETIRLGDVVLRLADTAGIRSTDDVVERIGVLRSKERMQRAALVLVVFDGSQPLSDDDRDLLELASQQLSIAIINKSDLPQQIDNKYIEDKIQQIVYIAAQKGEGVEALESAVSEVTGVANLSENDPLLAGERQRVCAVRALECLSEALDALQGGLTLDAVNVSIDGAISAILELTGELATEAIVDEVFARFCVGK